MTEYALPSVVTKRVRYFDGQFLVAQDLVDEQNYQRDREHRHNRLLHGPGIAEGLAVTSTELNKVTIAPGTAIDSNGYQLVLAEATPVDLTAADFNGKQGIELYISYQQSEADRQQQTEKGSEDFTRWSEVPQLTALAPGHARSGSAARVLLAKLALDASGRVTVDDTVRLYSGLRLPPYGPDATMRATSDGQVELAGSLTVDGRIGPGRKPQDSYFLAVRDLEPGPARITRFSVRGDGLVSINGNVGVGVGTADLENSENWSRILDVFGAHAKLSVRTPNIDARFMTNDSGYWGSPAGMVIGTRTNHALSLGTSANTRMTITGTGDVGVGTTTPENKENYWNRVLDILGDSNAKLSLRTKSIDARFITDTNGHWSSLPGMVIGMSTAHALSLGTNATTRMTITGEGNVGIGTTSPGAMLEVAGRLRSSSSDGGLWVGSGRDRFVGAHDTNQIGVFNGDWRLNVLNDGKVGIGTTSPQAHLEVAGDIRARNIYATERFYFQPATDWGKGDEYGPDVKRYWYFYRVRWNTNNLNPGTVEVRASGIPFPSDARLKEGIRQIADALDRIGRLRGVHYSWNPDGLRHLSRDIEATTTVGPNATQEDNEQLWEHLRQQRYEQLGGRRIGLLAQDVEKVAPELVSTDDQGFKSVDYIRLTPILVEAIKEQQSQIRSLNDRIAIIEQGA